MKNAANTRDIHRIGRGKKAFSDDLREGYEVFRRALENSKRHRIALLCGLVHEPRETRYARARVIFRVELPPKGMEIALPCGPQPQFAKQRRRTPVLIHSQRGAHRFAHNAPRASFIAEGVTPPARARNLPMSIFPHRYGPCAGDGDDPRLARVRSSQRYGQVIRDNQRPAFQDLAEYLLLAIDPTRESQASGFKLDGFGRKSRIPAGFGYGAGNRFDQTPAPFRTLNVVRLTAEASSENTARRIADYGLRARLSAIDAEVQLARS
ncbi:MAG TPA: hypothetical protein VG345_01395 [Bryobacteraceae bacterium]|nr:hypothetical protein [Bryobacteraceae bacterium]